MYTAVIILLILLGLVLIILELFVIPGITIAGVAGFVFTAAGIYLAYQAFGKNVGHLSLGLSLLFFILMLVFALRTGTWNRLMLTTEVNSTIEPISNELIHEGDCGVSITRLNPVGKVRINGITIEARCPNQFVDPESEVVVMKVYKNYVIVKLKS
ncbi:MAG: NfeD family protein [Breznakibacter sp.]|nr:NfeD family protein [Breznakibacter sp.]